MPLVRYFGGRRLCDITPELVKSYQVHRRASVSAATVNLDTKVLKLVLGKRIWNRISEEFKSLPQEKQGPGRALTDAEEKRLFDVASSNADWQVAYWSALLAANTTCRGGELKGLLRKHVDLATATLTIRRVTTKTEAGARIIPLNETALWACQQLLERAALVGATEADQYVLPAYRKRDGRLWFDPSQPMQCWKSSWHSLTRKAGLPGLRFHDLRHTSITKLKEANVPSAVILAIAGHSTETESEVYSHPRLDAKRAAVSVLKTR